MFAAVGGRDVLYFRSDCEGHGIVDDEKGNDNDTYHREMVGNKSQAEISDSNAESKNKEHQRPEVTLTLEMFACELEDFKQVGKDVALQ